MTAPLAHFLISGNSLIWSWFFWVYVHPLASIVWFGLSLFALLISIEVHQLQEGNKSSLIMPAKYQAVKNRSEVIDVIVIPPPQLGYTKQLQVRKSSLVVAQLPNSFD